MASRFRENTRLFHSRRSACILRDLLHGYTSLGSRLRTLSATCRRRGIRPSISRLLAEGRKIDVALLAALRGSLLSRSLPEQKTEEREKERIFAAHRLRYSVILCSAGASWKKYHPTLFRRRRFPWRTVRPEMKIGDTIVLRIAFEIWFDAERESIHHILKSTGCNKQNDIIIYI